MVGKLDKLLFDFVELRGENQELRDSLRVLENRVGGLQKLVNKLVEDRQNGRQQTLE